MSDQSLDVKRVGEVDPRYEGRRRTAFALELTEPLKPYERLELSSLVDGWYAVGSHGGFGGFLHSIDRSELDLRAAEIRWTVIGAAEPLALDVLIRCLESMIDEEFPFGRLVIDETEEGR